MKKYMPLEGLRWSRDSGSALCDTSQNSRSRTGWGVKHVFFSDGSAFPLWLVPILVVCLFGISYAIQVAYDYLINNFILKKK